MMSTKEIIDWNRQNAYKGKLGRSRELFCFTYLKHKASIIKNIVNGQIQDAATDHVEITCSKKCMSSTCCMQYVEATIQECEVIVYYLYNHKEALSNYLKNYPSWRAKVSQSGDLFKQGEKIWGEVTSSRKPNSDDSQLMDKIYQSHFQLHVPCPFLSENLCTIYEARPYTCAGYYSDSPIELCSVESTTLPPIHYAQPAEVLSDISFYHSKLSSPRILFMPTNIYEILIGGYSQIAKASGLPELEKEAKRQHLIHKG